MVLYSQALLESLRTAPLLVANLPEAAVFDRSLLGRGVPCRALKMNQKLGHLYEDALECLLDASDQVERLASHVQVVHSTGRTLGELDFILLDLVRAQPIHLELAVKFYLAVEGPEGWCYPGPDPRDNWQRKLDRMRAHQLVLSRRPEAQSLLRERFAIESIEVRQLIYGCLFYPMSSDVRPQPEAVQAGCRIGRWLYVSEWAKYFPDVEAVQLVPKVLWPVELRSEMRAQLECIRVDALKALAAVRCTLCMLPEGKEPIFLVPDDWRHECVALR